MKSQGIVRPVPAFLQREQASHELFMKVALDEAKRGIGRTAPNPTVGAVVVKNGHICAKGHHHAAGKPHAEIEALRQLSPAQVRGATIYITLEPCSTHGRTPPCTEAILNAGISRVVYGSTDPDPRHRGRAAKILRNAGIEVVEGVLSAECAVLNIHWNHRATTGLPWVIAKVGMSLDGRLDSPPHRRWITSPASRREAMQLRSSVEAILVGGNTIRTDDPALTVRGIIRSKAKPQPWRIIWSRSGALPKKAQVFTDLHHERTLVFTGITLQKLLQKLGKLGISSVLIEGGGQTLGDAFDRKLVDEIRFFIAPVIQGGRIPSVGGQGVGSNEEALRLTNVSYKNIGSDVIISANVEKNL